METNLTSIDTIKDVHSSVKLHQCKCGALFKFKDSLNRHTKNCRNRNQKKDVDTQQQKCHCGKSYHTKANLRRHQSTCNVPKPTKTQSRKGTRKTSQFLCDKPDCGSSYTTNANLKRHMATHDPEAQFTTSCPTCGKSWTRKYRYDQHVCKQNMPETECSPQAPNQRVKTHRIAKRVSQLLQDQTIDPDVKARVIKTVIDSPTKQTRKILERDGTINTKENQEKVIMYDCIIGDSAETMRDVKH